MSKEQSTNHYLAGKRAWSELYGSFIEERNRWRMVAMIAVTAALVLGLANIWQLTQAKVTPYVVEVDRAGRVSGVTAAAAIESRQEVIQYSLASFITAWRTVTADISLQEKFVKQASFVSIGAAKGALGEWYAQNNPYKNSEKKLVEVRIASLPLYVSGNTWSAEWEEITRNHAGDLQEHRNYKANLVIRKKAPETQMEIMRNATGIYVSEVSVSEKTNGGF
ncbi:type IV secretion system protein [Desulforhopalus singaporensis]|uniref:Type IV secretion system protein VirB5 n=1 Tax=Desulforhopalus singaporensis TaxID=91360 RepID=A0A1H0S2Q1_9BACT|nr:type IV secretion system protein [Desulforhopalus singaporensis]SDP35964.1 type IV secretion system protein VirB5 [Desulforhopalus singaporensis]